ncbi:pyruvate phosphate dikinase [Parvularcula bermudensis HTCC2503]|uniref:Pyruvate, phosphate dikinase n=1 Tax=Parvularcula bermudensis (strain ATCC BAA-594 / HTCC2503 / KCTC 12087) TaxID=314260 RepID=E0TCK4_PARBH|nr:pyruvate, phosphate dikinase [Parvularcula bermudensis]ADM08593.1 pyruvate phosphate dikinase [Parvularcula bermudensis HTCC2503]
MTQYIYNFGGGSADGRTDMRNLLGGKGANLAEMASLGLPVPPGFTITTEVCTAFYDNNRQYPEGLKDAVDKALERVESIVERKFGDAEKPLLVSVRSGARASMPGMMDTVLNLGLNKETVKGLAALAGDERFAYDSYRRFIQMYSNVVLQMDHHSFEEILDTYKDDRDYVLDTDLTAADWQAVIVKYEAAVQAELGKPFPQDVHEQLWGAIDAVFGSWMNDRSKTYRRLNAIPEDWGTAVNVQAMVFGNMGDTSATGVAFTRDPSTGENHYYGEFLVNAQGEDVVAGIRTPQNLTIAGRQRQGNEDPSLEEVMPETFKELTAIFQTLENHYRDMQDIEFTIQEGKLWMLQTRNGKRTAKAALKIAVDLAEEGKISEEEAVLRVNPAALDQLLHPSLDPKATRDLLTKGLPASPGAASGKVVFTADEAERLANDGQKVILVRTETSPEDIHGMHAAVGIVTARGGMTSHAAVVARGMGRPCVCGAAEVRIDKAGTAFTVSGRTVSAGDQITLDGATGEVFFGAVKTIEPELSGDFAKLMVWADKARRMKVRANAETPLDAKTARGFGAEGIGLCRTEHMFFDAERITVVRQMILARDATERKAALDKLLPFQRDDFRELFTVMRGLPVTVRLLDPPLHEFLPHTDKEIEEVAQGSGIAVDQLKARAKDLAEQNPMLGHRGCRLGVTFPEIYEMQVRAILEAACEVAAETGDAVVPEIMVPLVSMKKELAFLKSRIDAVATEVFADKGRILDYLVGTMVELPRAALIADEIAEEAAFFSFGTNDLTQTTYGLSRDDSGAFMPFYIREGLVETDPFVSLDPKGVGALVEIGAERGRQTRADIKLGICGEHGGDPASISICERIGLDYVSCSPYRVPIARLAAAQASLSGDDD